MLHIYLCPAATPLHMCVRLLQTTLILVLSGRVPGDVDVYNQAGEEVRPLNTHGA